MGSRGYAYQYETSPRKLEPEYDIPKKKSQKKLVKPKTKANLKKSQEKIKEKEAKVAQRNFVMVMIIVLGCILLMMYRNVKINESFSKVQALTRDISAIEKENSQISVNIQNNLNLSNIESIATSTLGMQKLSNKQTIYIALDTKDYVEVSANKNVNKKDEGFLKKLWKKVCEIF